MITPADFITLPFSQDVTLGGIAHLCRSLARQSEHPNTYTSLWMQRQVADTAVELAFRRLLASHHVPHRSFQAARLTNPGFVDVMVGGWRCVIKCYHGIKKRESHGARRDLAHLLKESMEFDIDAVETDHFPTRSLFIFACAVYSVVCGQSELERAVFAQKPIYLIHLLPKLWSRPPEWKIFSPLHIKSELSQTVPVELGGLGPDHAFRNEKVLLPPRKRLEIQTHFHTISTMHVGNIPDGRIGLHSPRIAKPYLIPHNAWENVWTYGVEIIFLGYMTGRDLRQNTSTLFKRLLDAPDGTTFEATKARCLSLPIAALHPLGDLFRRLRNAT